MTIHRMDNVAIVVDDLDAAIEFFTELGMELEGKSQIEGLWADHTVGTDRLTRALLLPHRSWCRRLTRRCVTPPR